MSYKGIFKDPLGAKNTIRKKVYTLILKYAFIRDWGNTRKPGIK